eukprot:scaffold25270_cov104-Isochrysis_galbana.AAC.3
MVGLQLLGALYLIASVDSRRPGPTGVPVCPPGVLEIAGGGGLRCSSNPGLGSSCCAALSMQKQLSPEHELWARRGSRQVRARVRRDQKPAAPWPHAGQHRPVARRHAARRRQRRVPLASAEQQCLTAHLAVVQVQQEGVARPRAARKHPAQVHVCRQGTTRRRVVQEPNERSDRATPAGHRRPKPPLLHGSARAQPSTPCCAAVRRARSPLRTTCVALGRLLLHRTGRGAARHEQRQCALDRAGDERGEPAMRIGKVGSVNGRGLILGGDWQRRMQREERSHVLCRDRLLNQHAAGAWVCFEAHRHGLAPRAAR